MSYALSLRRTTASRTLRLMALLAWLLMVVSMPAASAGSMPGMVHGVTSTTMGHAAHAMTMHGHHADHCCGGASHPSCQCEAMCGSVLLPAVPTLYGTAMLAGIQASMRSVDAPTPDRTPPLRPPAA
jgi:hypothetical protein